MQLTGQKLRMRKTLPRSNPWRVLTLLALIAGVLFYLRQLQTGAVESPFAPTPLPTPPPANLAREGNVHFASGRLEEAIQSYRQATAHDSTNAKYWIALSRIQVYSSTALTTDQQRRDRLSDALASARKAVEVDPGGSNSHAVLALALDWSATTGGPERDRLLNEAQEAAVRALQLIPGNPLASAYYAEILVDQQKWSQAIDVARQAATADPSLMDVHRVYGYVLESNGFYQQAIEEYRRALGVNPNLGFIYILIGANYRRILDVDAAIENFQKAASLNPKDKVPLLAIAKTYYQLGEYRTAAEYIQTALELDPTDPDVYGRLGLIYYNNRNYEGSIIELSCAVKGCLHPDTGATVAGLPLTPSSLEYYYTFASALAGLDDPGNAETKDYCQQATPLFDELRAFAPGDATVMAIVDEGITICNSVAPDSVPSATP